MKAIVGLYAAAILVFILSAIIEANGKKWLIPTIKSGPFGPYVVYPHKKWVYFCRVVSVINFIVASVYSIIWAIN